MKSLPSSTFTALDAIREAGIVIASDGAEYNKIGGFDPIDATTNPSLVYAAVCKPEYYHLVEEAVRYADCRLPLATMDEKTELALEHLLVQVGAQILALIPGRVSLSVDPRLGSSYNAILSKSCALIRLVDEFDIPRSRILIKIPATPAGIYAAHTLETQHGIHTNITLVFSLVQALACAQAGVSVLSPFIGRVKDWWAARAVANGDITGLDNQPLVEHPGIKLVHRIREAYKRYGYTTEVMAAGFRRPEEIVELSRAGSRGGADIMTLPPDLLHGLRTMEGELGLGKIYVPSPDILDLPESAPVYFTSHGPTAEGWASFDRDSELEAISLDKVPEGLAKFSLDAVKLEKKVRDLVEKESRSQGHNPTPTSPTVLNESRQRVGVN